MNYDAFMEPVTWFLTGMEKHSDAAIPEREGDCEGFWRAIRRSMASFSYGSLHTAMNQLDNHDHSRFITRTNGRTGRLESAGSAAAGEGIRMGVYRQAIVMQFTWPGAPTLYYGDETGLPGWTDPDDRRTFPWNRRDWELEEFCPLYDPAAPGKSRAAEGLTASASGGRGRAGLWPLPGGGEGSCRNPSRGRGAESFSGSDASGGGERMAGTKDGDEREGI